MQAQEQGFPVWRQGYSIPLFPWRKKAGCWFSCSNQASMAGKSGRLNGVIFQRFTDSPSTTSARVKVQAECRHDRPYGPDSGKLSWIPTEQNHHQSAPAPWRWGSWRERRPFRLRQNRCRSLPVNNRYLLHASFCRPGKRGARLTSNSPLPRCEKRHPPRHQKQTPAHCKRALPTEMVKHHAARR